MNKLVKFLACFAGFSTLVGCSEENIPAGKENTGGDFYTAVSINFANGTRSATDDPKDDYSASVDGTEVGQDDENNINSVIIVLATAESGKDPEVIAWKHVSATSAESGNGAAGENVYVAAFQSEELESMAGEQFQPIVFCNPTNKIVDVLSRNTQESRVNLAELSYTLESESDAYAWTTNAFLMTNAKGAAVKTLPSEGEFNQYPETNPFSLGEVEVERAAVRFDLKKANDNLYSVDSDNEADAKLQLVKVGLFNMSKSFYYLRRVSEDGTKTGWKIGKPEQKWATTNTGAVVTGNYVVDTDYVEKNNFGHENQDALSGFFYGYKESTDKGILDSESGIVWSNVDDIFNNDREDDEDWNAGKTEYDGYHIWRYATENTIPSVTQQKIGISTGVYFCTKIVPTETSRDLKDDMKNKETLYVFEDKLYGSWSRVETAASNTPGSVLAAAVEKVQKEIPADKTIKDVDKEVLSGLGFKAYSSDDNGDYYVYYVYKNRHNDNGNNTVMQAMEFATVRNNVYKLQLNSINMWGHPTNPEDPDPDPEDPDDPDEGEKVYFKVNVRVLPWVVRINNVSF